MLTGNETFDLDRHDDHDVSSRPSDSTPRKQVHWDDAVVDKPFRPPDAPETTWSRDRLRRLPKPNQKYKNGDYELYQYPATEVPPTVSRLARKKRQHRQRLLQQRELGDQLLQAIDLAADATEDLLTGPLSRFIKTAAVQTGLSSTEAQSLLVEWIHPFFLKAKAEASKGDNPSWKQAMNGPFADEFWGAAVKEYTTLEGMDAWEVVDRPPPELLIKVLDIIWAFKIKRFPDGRIKGFKGRLCARGDQQVEGVDFFETYAPVVQWTTIRLMLILEVLLGLKSKQGDVLAAFLHAKLPDDEHVYVEMPVGFRQPGKVLKLKKTLYGLRQSPRAFWKYMVEKMESCGLQQSKFDPCLFIGEKVICVCYVDDLIFWSRDEADIDSVAMQLRGVGVDLEQETDAAGFLGIKMERDTPLI